MTEDALAVSVIMPAHNAAQTIADSLDSVWHQTCQPAEVIVIDDGSTDRTGDLLARYGDKIRYRRQANAGPSAARNHGWKISSGDVITFLDADDLWPDHALEVLTKNLLDHPAAGIVRGRVQNMWFHNDQPDGCTLEEPKPGHNLGSAAFRRSVFAQLGGLDPAMRTGEDIDLWLRARERGISTLLIDDVILFYRRKLADRIDGKQMHLRNVARILKRSIDRNRGRTP